MGKLVLEVPSCRFMFWLILRLNTGAHTSSSSFEQAVIAVHFMQRSGCLLPVPIMFGNPQEQGKPHRNILSMTSLHCQVEWEKSVKSQLSALISAKTKCKISKFSGNVKLWVCCNVTWTMISESETFCGCIKSCPTSRISLFQWTVVSSQCTRAQLDSASNFVVTFQFRWSSTQRCLLTGFAFSWFCSDFHKKTTTELVLLLVHFFLGSRHVGKPFEDTSLPTHFSQFNHTHKKFAHLTCPMPNSNSLIKLSCWACQVKRKSFANRLNNCQLRPEHDKQKYFCVSSTGSPTSDLFDSVWGFARNRPLQSWLESNFHNPPHWRIAST